MRSAWLFFITMIRQNPIHSQQCRLLTSNKKRNSQANKENIASYSKEGWL